jgi:hypothetical protein
MNAEEGCRWEGDPPPYIGTLGMKGAFEAMWTGEVDFNWAKEHHDLWLEDELAKDRPARSPRYPSPLLPNERNDCARLVRHSFED